MSTALSSTATPTPLSPAPTGLSLQEKSDHTTGRHSLPDISVNVL